MTTAALDRRAPARRLGMKILSALLTAACAIVLMAAFAQLKPASEWRVAPQQTSTDAPNWAVQLRDAVWPQPILRADPADTILAGRFISIDGEGPQVTFDGASIRIDGGLTLYSRPWRIAAGGERWAAGRTYARDLAAAADAQIELRRITPADGETPAPNLPDCGDQPPGLAALLHRGDRVDVMLFRAGSTPGPDGSAQAVCATWTLVAG